MSVSAATGRALRDVVAEEVRAVLARRQRTGRWLAALLHISPQAMSRRMTGELPFTVDELDRVAHALDVPVTRLLGLDGDRPLPPPALPRLDSNQQPAGYRRLHVAAAA